jgi:radical SAM protein with 4Fe4S-binding SPASM domain
MNVTDVNDLDGAFVPGKNVAWERRDGYWVLGGGAGGALRIANDAVIELLQRLDSTTSVDQLARETASAHGVSVLEATQVVCDALNGLIDEGIVVAKSVSNSNETYGSARPARNSDLFTHLFFELTSRCNLRCKHCYMEGGLARPKELRLQDFVNLVEEFSALGGQFLTLSGGEPLLFPGWAAVAGVGAEHGLQLSLMTNGTYLDRSVISVLRRLQVTVGLGFDGFTAASHDANRGKASYLQATRALRLLLDEGYADKTTICFTPLRYSVYDLPALIEMMLQHGLPRLYVSLLEDRGRAEFFRDRIALTTDQRRWLLQYLFDMSIQTMGTLTIEVTHHTDIFGRLLYDQDPQDKLRKNMTIRIPSDGDVYLSAYMGAPEHCVGRVGELSLSAMLESDVASGILSALEDRTDRIAKCQSCVYRQTCGGGSAALAYSRFGTFDEPDEYCDSRIDLFNEVAERRARALSLAET